jgi:hypothetical protein
MADNVVMRVDLCHKEEAEMALGNAYGRGHEAHVAWVG